MRKSRLNLPLVCFFLALATPAVSFAQISVVITIGPPPIPMYEQPFCPGDGYVWAPGYWAWGDDGYFWVPGTWVRAPEIGLLWTPGYWGWSDEAFVFHTGYWGSEVGFYGGINYGYGYGGSGFDGGYWQGRDYYYNRSITNVNITRITNVYTKTVIVNNNTYVAYNGGAGGLRTAPTSREKTAEREHHVAPTSEQNQQHQIASQNRGLLASVNRGKPPVAATVRPADFSPKNIVPARSTGGHVDEAALKATPRTLPPPPGRRAVETRPGNPTIHPESRTPEPQPAHGNRPPSTVAPPPAPKPQAPPPDRRAPDRRPEPAPRPAPQPNREPAPHQAPKPFEVRPDRPTPDRRPAPEPHPAPEPNREPPRQAPKPQPKPEPPH